jgi:hypothetical protein
MILVRAGKLMETNGGLHKGIPAGRARCPGLVLLLSLSLLEHLHHRRSTVRGGGKFVCQRNGSIRTSKLALPAESTTVREVGQAVLLAARAFQLQSPRRAIPDTESTAHTESRIDGHAPPESLWQRHWFKWVAHGDARATQCPQQIRQ